MFFDSIAHAMGAAPGGGGEQGGSPLTAFLPLIIMFAIFYFLLIRPQQKKAKMHKQMLADLKRGDYVLTSGGMYGRIQEIDGDVLTVELSENLKVKVNRGFISSKSDKTGGAVEDSK